MAGQCKRGIGQKKSVALCVTNVDGRKGHYYDKPEETEVAVYRAEVIETELR